MGISGSQSHPNSSPVVFLRAPSWKEMMHRWRAVRITAKKLYIPTLSLRPGRWAVAVVALMVVKYVSFKELWVRAKTWTFILISCHSKNSTKHNNSKPVKFVWPDRCRSKQDRVVHKVRKGQYRQAQPRCDYMKRIWCDMCNDEDKEFTPEFSCDIGPLWIGNGFVVWPLQVQCCGSQVPVVPAVAKSFPSQCFPSTQIFKYFELTLYFPPLWLSRAPKMRWLERCSWPFCCTTALRNKIYTIAQLLDCQPEYWIVRVSCWVEFILLSPSPLV